MTLKIGQDALQVVRELRTVVVAATSDGPLAARE